VYQLTGVQSIASSADDCESFDALCATLFGFALGASEAVDLQLRGSLAGVSDREAQAVVGQPAALARCGRTTDQ